jgi:hypothetical protein
VVAGKYLRVCWIGARLRSRPCVCTIWMHGRGVAMDWHWGRVHHAWVWDGDRIYIMPRQLPVLLILLLLTWIGLHFVYGGGEKDHVRKTRLRAHEVHRAKSEAPPRRRGRPRTSVERDTKLVLKCVAKKDCCIQGDRECAARPVKTRLSFNCTVIICICGILQP